MYLVDSQRSHQSTSWQIALRATLHPRFWVLQNKPPSWSKAFLYLWHRFTWLILHIHMTMYIYIYTIIYIYDMSSRQNPLHVSSCYCHSYRLWEGLSLSRVLWKSAYSRSNMKPKSIPKQARTWIEAFFCWFQVLRQHFMFFNVACVSCHFPFIIL